MVVLAFQFLSIYLTSVTLTKTALLVSRSLSHHRQFVRSSIHIKQINFQSKSHINIKIPDVCHNLHIYIRNRTVIQCYLQQLSVDIKQRQAYATNTVSFTHFFIGPCNDLSLNNRVSSILAGQLGQYAQCVRFHQLPNQCYENKHKNLVCYTQSAKNTSIYLLWQLWSNELKKTAHGHGIDTRPWPSWLHVCLCQLVFQSLNNPMAYLGQMARDLMACPWSHGRRQTPLLGCDGPAHWPTLTPLHAVYNRLRRCGCRVGRHPQGREIQRTGRPEHLPAHCCSLLAPWTTMLASSLPILVGGFRVWQGNHFLFQRISVLLFGFNSVLLHNSFVLDDRLEHYLFHSFSAFQFFSYPCFNEELKK